jgi:hypothetical protein
VRNVEHFPPLSINRFPHLQATLLPAYFMREQNASFEHSPVQRFNGNADPVTHLLCGGV